MTTSKAVSACSWAPTAAIESKNGEVGTVRSPLLFLFLVVLGWPMAVLLPLLGYDAYQWLRDQFPRPPPVLSTPAAVEHPAYHLRALAALQRFAELPPVEQQALRQHLQRRLLPPRDWLSRLAVGPAAVLCLGENHSERTRRFLARVFFAAYPVDTLLLETTPARLATIESRLADGWPYIPMLDADVAAVLRAARRANPAVQVMAIDASGEQRAARRQQGLEETRESTIVDNFRSAYRPGQRIVILFGALHCTPEAGWLYGRLLASAIPAQERLLNVRVLGRHQDGPLEAFVYFLDHIGLYREAFAIIDPEGLHPLIRDWFPLLVGSTLDRFRVLLVFRL